MGCSCAHEIRSESQSEDAVHASEATLGFSSRQVVDLAADLKVFSSCGMLTVQQLRDTLFSQSLNWQDLDNEVSPAALFYAKFAVGKKYDARKLTALAVLLSGGTFEKKGEIIFDSYQSSGLLGSAGLKAALEDLSDIALDYLPAYAAAQLELSKDEEALRKLTNFRQRLELARPLVVTKLSDLVLAAKPSLTLSEFQKAEGINKMCSAQSFRRLAAGLSREARR